MLITLDPKPLSFEKLQEHYLDQVGDNPRVFATLPRMDSIDKERYKRAENYVETILFGENYRGLFEFEQCDRAENGIDLMKRILDKYSST